MRAPLIALFLSAVAGGATAADPPVTTPIGAYAVTNSGQPIMPPPGPVQVTALTVEIPVGGVLPTHRHPHQRYGYVLSGRIRVDNLDTGTSVEYGPGEVIIEARDQWHSGATQGAEPARLLVIDQTPPGAGPNVERKGP